MAELLPAVRASADVAELSDDELLDGIRQSVEDLKSYLEEAVRRRMSQTLIGEALGIDQSGVSRKMKALGVSPKQVQDHSKGMRSCIPSESDSPATDLPVIHDGPVDGEVVEDVTEPVLADA